MELRPKFGEILQLDEPSTKARLLQGSSGARVKICEILKQDKPNTTAQLLQGSSGARAKILQLDKANTTSLLHQG